MTRRGRLAPPVAAIAASLLLCSILPSSVRAWVAERSFNIEEGGGAQTWLYSKLGPGGSRPFKFVGGGTAELVLSCKWKHANGSSNVDDVVEWIEDGAYLLLCQAEKKARYTDGKSTPCFSSAERCVRRFQHQSQYSCSSVTPGLTVKRLVRDTNTSVLLTSTQHINASARATFVVVTCCSQPSPASYQCEATLELVNPGGNQLSADEFGLPRLYLACSITYCTILAMWLLNAAFYWRFVNRLHLLITSLLVVRTAEACAQYWVWTSIEHTGVEDSKKTVRDIITAAKWSFYFLVVMSAGFGMGITTKNPVYPKRIIACNVLILGSLIIYFFWDDYALALTVIIALLGIFSTIRSLRYMLARFDRFLTMERKFFRDNEASKYTSTKTLPDRVRGKIHLVRVLLVYSLAFPLVYVVGSAVATARSRYEVNIQLLTQETIEVCFLLAMVWSFRLHDCYQYACVRIDGKSQASSYVMLGAGKKTMFYSDDKRKTKAK